MRSLICLCIVLLLHVCGLASQPIGPNDKDNITATSRPSLSIPLNTSTTNVSGRSLNATPTTSVNTSDTKERTSQSKETSMDRSTTTDSPIITKLSPSTSPATPQASSEPPAAEASPTPEAASGGSGSAGLAIGLLLLALVLLAGAFGCSMRMDNAVGAASRRCWRGLRERVDASLTAIETRFGISLRPPKGAEEGDEEGEEMIAVNGQLEKRNGKASERVEEEQEEEEERVEEHRDEEGDSSDDYSSLEGMDLREQARQKQEDGSGSGSGSGSSLSRSDQERTSVTPGEGGQPPEDGNDLTAL